MRTYAVSVGITVLIGLCMLSSMVGSPLFLPRPRTVALTPEIMERDWKNYLQQQELERVTKLASLVLSLAGCDQSLAPRIAHYSLDQNLDGRLVAAEVVVESSCDPEAISPAGATGLMQVMPKMWGYSRRALLDPDTNLQAGTRILARHVRAYGLRDGLRFYFGVTEGSDKSDEYAERVLAMAGRR